ncbi:MAG: hypothetical protein R3F38_20050 [Gammaproteobacteria bacterium]
MNNVTFRATPRVLASKIVMMFVGCGLIGGVALAGVETVPA